MKLSEMKRIKQERLNFILNNQNLSTEEICKELNIKRESVYKLKSELGLTVNKNINDIRSKIKEEKKKFILEHRQTMTYEEMAEKLNCSVTNIQKISSELLHDGLFESKINPEKLILKENEEFRSLEQFNCSAYSVSNYGRIKNNKDEIIKQYINLNGYPSVKLYNDFNKYQSFLVHRLVAIMFIENNDPTKNEVDHINGNKNDNNVNNLQWLSCLKNSRKSNSKHTENEIKSVCELLEQKIKIKDIQEKYPSFSRGVLLNIKNHKSWKDISANYNF